MLKQREAANHDQISQMDLVGDVDRCESCDCIIVHGEGLEAGLSLFLCPATG